MIIEVLVDGQVKHIEYHDTEILTGSADELGYKRRQLRWQAIAYNAMLSMGTAGLDASRCQVVFNIKASIQPKDISAKEMQEFEKQLTNAKFKI